MHINNQYLDNAVINILKPAIKIRHEAANATIINSAKRLRFEEKKERYIWVHPDEICFVKSADHYVKSLVQCGKEKKWVSRHNTLKDLLDQLSSYNFIRLNKFYLINQNYFSHINENEKLLYLNDNFPIPVPHRISPYVLLLLNGSCT